MPGSIVGAAHQIVVGSIGVILWERDVDSQGYAVGEDGHEDEDVKGSGGPGVKGTTGGGQPSPQLLLPHPITLHPIMAWVQEGSHCFYSTGPLPISYCSQTHKSCQPSPTAPKMAILGKSFLKPPLDFPPPPIAPSNSFRPSSLPPAQAPHHHGSQDGHPWQWS